MQSRAIPYNAVQYITIPILQYNTMQYRTITLNALYNTAFALCKTRLPNLARDKLSDHDSENCSDVRAVTWFRICPCLAEKRRK